MALEYRVLSRDVEPVHYDISLFDLDIDPNGNTSKQTFRGRVLIDLDVKTRIRTITLNTHLLDNITACVLCGGNTHPVQVAPDGDVQQCHLHLDGELPLGHVQLQIEYRGLIGSDLVGFYQSSKTIFCTQFQPSDARRAFPCFDEPSFKATFALSIDAPDSLTILGNMPVKERRSSERNPAHSVIQFETTPRMSTYLVAWAIGDFEYRETLVPRKSTTKPLPVRVYTPKGMLEQGKTALDTARKVLPLFAEIFGIDYPLPKADLLAVPEMSDDAMENWGLIIFRETALLLAEDPRLCPERATHVEYIIAHEIAHSWFGNLVTMQWWDELWLNEGFATWAGWYAVDKLHPDWDVWSQFLVDDMQEAFELDSMKSSHPVQVHVADGLEVDSIFDAISYLKGASIIRMLAGFLGETVFLEGVGSYLQKFSYQNAPGDALWSSLREVSDQDVANLTRSWITAPGFPVVTWRTKGSAVELSQTPFEASDLAESGKTWWIPIVASTLEGPTTLVLKSRNDSAATSHTISKFNLGHVGFYRTQLNTEEFLDLTSKLETLSTQDRAGLLADAIALATIGRGVSAPTIMSALPLYCNETHYSVWYVVLETINKIKSITLDWRAQAAMDAFTRHLTESKVKSLGWECNESDTYNSRRLRALLIRTASIAVSQPFASEALRRFDLFISNREQISSVIRGPVLDAAVAQRGLYAVEPLWKLYQTTEDGSIREDIINAIGQTPESQAQACLDLVFNGGIASQDLENLARAFTANPRTSGVMFTFMTRRWDDISVRVGGSMAIFERFVRWSLPKMASFEEAATVERFFFGKDTTGYGRGLQTAIESIKSNALFREREEEGIAEWLKAEGYLPEAE